MSRLFITLFVFNSIFAQTFRIDNSLGQFTQANAFAYHPAGYIYVSDAETNEITKLDSLGNIIKNIGGYGWDNDNFDQVADIFANTLNIYIVDRNNHRIQVFDKDLNFNFGIVGKQDNNNGNYPQNDDNVFGFPLSCAVSNLGEIYVLDSENKKIVKFDSQGNYILNFGSYDNGAFTLSNPSALAISSDNRIYVLDDQQLIIFDQFGNGLMKVDIPDVNNINISFDNLILISADKIFYSDLKEDSDIKELSLKRKDGKIVDAIIMIENKLYILTESGIEVLKKEKAE